MSGVLYAASAFSEKTDPCAAVRDGHRLLFTDRRRSIAGRRRASGRGELSTSSFTSRAGPTSLRRRRSVVTTAHAERSHRALNNVVLIDELDSWNAWCELEAPQPELLDQFAERFIHGEVVGQQLG